MSDEPVKYSLTQVEDQVWIMTPAYIVKRIFITISYVINPVFFVPLRYYIYQHFRNKKIVSQTSSLKKVPSFLEALLKASVVVVIDLNILEM